MNKNQTFKTCFCKNSYNNKNIDSDLFPAAQKGLWFDSQASLVSSGETPAASSASVYSPNNNLSTGINKEVKSSKRSQSPGPGDQNRAACVCTDMFVTVGHRPSKR